MLRSKQFSETVTMKYILILAAFFLLCELSQQFSAEEYCKLASFHSACRTTTFGPECENPKQAIPTEADKKAILDWHNSIREQAASGKETGALDGTLPQASNMRKLVWDDELAYIAQAWSGDCMFGHDSYEARATLNGKFRSVGQITAIFGTTESLTNINFVEVMKSWYRDEVGTLPQYVLSNFNSITAPGPAGHYTQLIWANTEAVGCGGTVYKSGMLNNVFVVCNYGEGGNVLGDTVYKIGTPCSACPSGTSCSGSLCA